MTQLRQPALSRSRGIYDAMETIHGEGSASPNAKCKVKNGPRALTPQAKAFATAVRIFSRPVLAMVAGSRFQYS
jgi:hypothetical protein